MRLKNPFEGKPVIEYVILGAIAVGGVVAALIVFGNRNAVHKVLEQDYASSPTPVSEKRSHTQIIK